MHAPQWPSPHATFVPVRPSSSRSVSARLTPTGAELVYEWPLTRSVVSGTGGHRENVGEVHEPERGARRDHALAVLLDLR